MHIAVDPAIRTDHARLCLLVKEGFAGVDAGGVEVRVERARRRRDSFSGTAYPYHPARQVARAASRYLVRLKIPSVLRNRSYPRSYRYACRKTAPWITVRTWQERFVALVAHEACHIRQFRESLRRSEVEAERWAEGVLGRWVARREVGQGRILEPRQLSLFRG